MKAPCRAQSKASAAPTLRHLVGCRVRDIRAHDVDAIPVGTIVRPEGNRPDVVLQRTILNRVEWATMSPRNAVLGYSNQPPGSFAALLSSYGGATIVYVPVEPS